MRGIAHLTYSFVLRLHPYEFQAEFGEEIQWIFAEEMASCKSRAIRIVLYLRLMLDLLRSAYTQQILREQQQPSTAGPRFAQISPSSSLVQIAEASFLVFACLFTVVNIAICARMVITTL